MTSELRRSFKEKAKEKLSFGFRSMYNSLSPSNERWINRRSNPDVTQTPSPDEAVALPGTVALGSDSLRQTPLETELHPAPRAVSNLQDAVPTRLPSTADMDNVDNAREKRRSRHLVQPKGSLTYEVSGRDTLASIAAQFDTTTSELKKLNKLMTTMVFPGQTVYVPDKDYIPSEGSTPTSPIDPGFPVFPGSLSPPPQVEGDKEPSPPQTHNGTTSPQLKESSKAAFDLKLKQRLSRGPGLAERLRGSDSGSGHIPPPSDLEVHKLEADCCEKFIKVNVKHITDGQGVVNGVLLVTPNAIMFDPNVSDPLVVDRGAEEYGMIAPMDTIISAAMYHDIAAMNRRKHKKSGELQKEPEVYHDKSCPLYIDKEVQEPEPEVAPPDVIPTVSPRMTRSESVCSCGAMDKDKWILGRDRIVSEPGSSNGAHVITTNNSKPTVGFTGSLSLDSETDTKRKPSIVPEETSGDSLLNQKSDDDLTEDNTQSADKDSVVTDSHELDSAHSVMAATTSDSAKPVVTLGDASSPPGDKSSISADSATFPAETNQLDSSVAGAAGSGSHSPVTCSALPSSGEGATSEGKSPGGELTNTPEVGNTPTSLTPHMQIGNIQYFQCDSTDQRRSPSPQRDDLSVPRDSGGSPRPSSSPKEQGLLSRTLGSLSSLGSSFPGSPNLTSIATGLFSWTDGMGDQPCSAASLLRDKSMDENEVFIEPDGRSGGHDGSKAQSHQGPRTHTIMDIEVEVENIVKLGDKPDLFKDLSELIPRPATHYEDPPLYLCLRIGLPSNKKISKTCPIESYMKQKLKPEYWFSIPRDKVDPLYAFFVQWSPNIYGSEGEINAKDRGFVVVNDSDEEHEIDIIENHFDRKATRQVTKDWEMVNLEEARRRLSYAEVENLPMPDLSDPSNILTDIHVRRLCLHLPARAEGYPWTLIYSSEKHGFSLKTLYRSMQNMDCPILLVVKDTHGQVFGAILPCAILMSDHFYGTGESFLFTFYPEFRRFGWSGTNNFYIKGNAESLAFGAGTGSNGLWFDGDLYHGRTQNCETYDNDLLTETEDFVIKCVEAWGFV